MNEMEIDYKTIGGLEELVYLTAKSLTSDTTREEFERTILNEVKLKFGGEHVPLAEMLIAMTVTDEHGVTESPFLESRRSAKINISNLVENWSGLSVRERLSYGLKPTEAGAARLLFDEVVSVECKNDGDVLTYGSLAYQFEIYSRQDN
ncbi:hypothetical protein [Vibrio crassostreae]|uniref:hypothetical protein n=1 Tax=Vibrio crassostreae TaxID=246167 RepID=UPI001B3184D2|nr:hypothetical protein [Vibrio crassostreae]